MSDFLVTFPPAFDEGGTFDKSGRYDDLYAWLLGHKISFSEICFPFFKLLKVCKGLFSLLMKSFTFY